MIGTNYSVKTRKLLRDTGCYVEGDHFVNGNGMHCDFFLNSAALYAYPKKLDDISVMLTDLALNTFTDFQVVLAPAISGIILGQAVAYNLALELQNDIMFAFAEQNKFDNTHKTIKRGYEGIIKGKKVLLVDDISTTGKTLVEMAQCVLSLQGDVVGAAVVCDRGQVRTLSFKYGDETHSIKIAPLVELDLQLFPPSNCPLCKSGRPINSMLGEGSGIDQFKKINQLIDERNKCDY
jgi:orotate phosphoribosyltransferase